MATTDSNLQVINSMTEEKLSELKDSSGKIPSMANQLIVTDDATEEPNIVLYDEQSQTTQEMNVLLNTIYPVGSIRLSVNSGETNFMGGTWEQIAQGRTIFGAGTLNGNTYTAGTTKDAGLPNIEGKWRTGWNQPSRGFHALTAEGAFYDSYPEYDAVGRITAEDANNGGTRGFPWFDASRSNSIYGSSTTVQPPAFVCYIYRRIS